MITQVLSVISFIVGIFIGEKLTEKIFGQPKRIAIIIDIVIFAIIISLLSESIIFTEINFVYYLTNLIVGLITIVLVRLVELPFGLTEPREGNQLIENIIKTFSRHGLTKQEIKQVLHESSFPPKIVEKYDKVIEDRIPKLLPRLVKMEKQIEDVSSKLDELVKWVKKSKERDSRDAVTSTQTNITPSFIDTTQYHQP